MKDASQVEYVIRLRPLKSDVPPVHRLRSLLKIALRGLQLRATSVEEAPAQPTQTGNNQETEGQ